MSKRIISFCLALLLLCTPFALGAVAAGTNPNIPVMVGVDVVVKTDFTVRFYIQVAEDTTEAGVYFGEERIKGERIADDMFRVSVPYFSSKKMMVFYMFEPYAVIGKSTNLRGTPYAFSLADYAMGLLTAQEPLTPEARAALVAMLNFGAHAQKEAAYYPNNLPNAYLSSADKTVTERPYTTVIGAVGDAADYLPVSLSVQFMFRETVAMVLYARGQFEEYSECYLEIADEPTFATPARYLFDWTQSREENTEDGTYYTLLTETDGIYLNSLSKTYYLRVVTPEGESQPLAYSIESYAYLGITQNDPNMALSEERKDFIRALMAFADALRAYDAAGV